MKIEHFHSARWADDAKTLIDCVVKFAEFDDEIPYTAAAHDGTEHGRELFEQLSAGPIDPYEPPAMTVMPVTKL